MFKSLFDATVCPAALTSTCGNHACHISMLTVDSFLLRTLLNVVPSLAREGKGWAPQLLTLSMSMQDIQ